MSEVKILVCDDDPDLLGLLQRRLKKMGIEPDVASNGRQAMGFVDENEYDVIVADIYMPEATGLEVMQHAKQKDPDTQTVIITSSATLENAIDALNHGAFGYLTKPFDHLIVFDNMVSRALEYRTLLVADKRKAEAQRRRGDMLEDEVEQRVKQLQKTQKGLLDLLGSLPDGILVVEEGGKVVLSSPVGERWLALDGKTEDQPIHAFIGQIHAEAPEPYANVEVDDVDLHLLSADFPAEGELKRKAVIIREVEDDSAGAGSMVTETVMGIKKGLATLYEQGMGTEVVLNVASQFAVLEQLQGWSVGTGELKPSEAAIAQEPTPKEETPSAELIQEQTSAPEELLSEAAETPQEPEKSQSAPPDNPAPPAPDASEVTSIPPFTLPRERTPTGELEGPRLNTSELQEALRAAAPPGDQKTNGEPAPPEVSIDSEDPAVDPNAETLVSNTPEEPELSDEPDEAEPAAELVTQEDIQPEETIQSEESSSVEIPDIPAAPVDNESPADGQSEEVAQEIPVEETALDTEPVSQGLPENQEPQIPPFKEETSGEPDTQPTGVAAPVSTDEEPAPPWEDLEQLDADSVSESDLESFPKVESNAGDVPSWIDGIEGNTDPDLLQDFEFAGEEPEPTFPKDQTGNLDDDSMYKPRVIPEEMNAKLETPTELPNANGNEEYAPPEHAGPITIQASEADTQLFRKVLEGLSGTKVLSGDYEKSAEEPVDGNGDKILEEVVEESDDFNDLRAKFGEPPESEVQPTAETPPPAPEELRAEHAPEPEPQPVPAKPAQWPPVLPTEDEEFDDELDVSG